MLMKRNVMLSAFAATAIAATALPASAEDTVYMPLLTYRTGAFAGSGVHIANGMHDYLEMLNKRDGGIGGAKIIVEECETGYDTKKGVECYESTKGKNPAMYNPYSTGITLQLIPKAAVDKIPVLSMAYGLSASADGTRFPWIFNPPVTYWDGASVFIRHVLEAEKGNIKGKTIGLIHLDAPFGKEPIPVLEALAKEYGFNLKLYPIPAAQMQNQGSTWLAIRRDRVDWIYNQGWGAMNPTAVKEAVKNGFPIDKMVGVWWAGADDDARAGEDKAKGYKTLNFHNTGASFPALQDIIKLVIEPGLSQAKKENVGENLYNRGVYNAMLMAEAVRSAQKVTGKKAVTGEDVRRGLEALDITEARLKEIGFEGFAAPVKISCTDHNGHNKVFISQWDGTKYVKGSEWMEPLKKIVLPLIDEAAKEYETKNTGWPKRSEACDKAA
jgi:branched-chain amino acid transport system substrate-binding protein